MPSLAESLNDVIAIKGVRAAALIDVETGMVVETAGQSNDDLALAAASMAGEARTARWTAGPDLPAGDLDKILLVTGSRLQVTKMLEPRLGEGLLLFVDLDRAQANMALASRRVDQLAPEILA